MQMTKQNPAIALRARIREASLPGFLRWDDSGRALLLSDAPRRDPSPSHAERIRALGASCFFDRLLLYVDLPESAYRRIASVTFFAPGPFVEPYVSMQALLSGILSRGGARAGEPDIPLLRAAVLSCARGEAYVARFVGSLASHDAAALRKGQTQTVHACAALCAHYLYTQKAVGLPTRAKAL